MYHSIVSSCNNIINLYLLSCGMQDGVCLLSSSIYRMQLNLVLYHILFDSLQQYCFSSTWEVVNMSCSILLSYHSTINLYLFSCGMQNGVCVWSAHRLLGSWILKIIEQYTVQTHSHGSIQSWHFCFSVTVEMDALTGTVFWWNMKFICRADYFFLLAGCNWSKRFTRSCWDPRFNGKAEIIMFWWHDLWNTHLYL